MRRGTMAVYVVADILLAAAIALFIYRQQDTTVLSSASFENVTSAVTAAADMDVMQEGDNQMVRRLYGLDPSQIGDIVLYYPTANMGADELLLVRLSDEVSASSDDLATVTQQVTDAIENRRNAQMTSFDGYAPESYTMIENSIVDVQGNYILFISAEDPQRVDEAFRDALQEGGTA